MWTVVRVTLLAALLGVVCASVWLASTESALHWVVSRLEAASGGRLRVEGAQGSLLGPLAAERVRYVAADLAVEVGRPELAVQWHSLARGALVLSALTARSIEVRTAPGDGEPPRLPESLALPVKVEVTRFAIERLVLLGTGEPVALAPLRGAYAGGPTRHRLQLERLGTPWGEADGELTLGATPPFAVAATLHFNTRRTHVPAALQARIDGDLRELRVALGIVAGGARGEGEVALAPFAADWLPRAALTVRDVSLAEFAAGAPRTAARVEASLAGGKDGMLRGTLAASNAAAGPLSAGRLPLAALRTEVMLQGAALALEALDVDLGAAGRVRGTLGFAEGRARFDLAVEALNLHAVHAKVHATALRGTLRGEATEAAQTMVADLRDDALAVSAELRRAQEVLALERFRAALRGGVLTGSGRLALGGERKFAARVQARGFDPAAFGEWPQARLNGSLEAEGALAPAWRAAVRASIEDGRYGNAALTARVAAEVVPQSVRGLAADVRIGANRLRLAGDFGRPQDALEVRLEARDLKQIDARLGGQVTAEGKLRGSWERIGGTLEARASALAFAQQLRVGTLHARAALDVDAERRIEVLLKAADLALPQASLAHAELAVTGTERAHEIVAQARAAQLDARLVAAGGWFGELGWRGSVRELANRGSHRVALQAPVALEAQRGRIALGPAVLEVLGGEIALDGLRFADGRLESAGRLRALPVLPLVALGDVPVLEGSDLTLRGAWSIVAGPRMNGTLRVERDAGDLMLSRAPRVAAGLAALALEARIADDAVDANAALRSTRFGSARLTLRVAPAADGLTGAFAPQSRLDGTLVAGVPALSALQELIGGPAAIDGRVEAALGVRGTLGAPVFSGQVSADQVRVDMPQHALALHDGTARLRLDAQVLHVERLSIRGTEGELRAHGGVPLGKSDASLAWQADGLRLFNRPDRQLVVSGAGQATLAEQRVVLLGELKADLGVFELPEPQTPPLGDDVVVLGRKVPAAKQARGRPPLALDLVVDAGERLRVRARGLETELRGRLRLRTRDDGELAAHGTIETRGGRYRAFGQRLAIERGRLLFDGPVGNPGLDVLALRKNQAVEAGVQVLGTVRSPVVRLVSNPPVPDQEKLSWLMLGRGAASAGGAETAMLQAAVGALAGGAQDGAPGGALARELGVDEIGLRGGAAGPAVAIGKRLTERLSLEYEQGLTAAAALVRLKLILTRTLNATAEASGQGGSIGIGYGKSYE